MKNQDPWEPTFHTGYTLSPKASYVGGISTRPTPGPTYPARWPTSDTSAAPTVAAAAATVALTLKTESARRSSGRGGGGNPGRGSGGTGGGGEGSKERLNAMAHNNPYVEGRWGLLRNVGAMRLITCKASLAGIDLPALPVEPNCKACRAFHIKGMCNMGCRNADNHVEHTREQDPSLWGWSVRAMLEITAPSAPVA